MQVPQHLHAGDQPLGAAARRVAHQHEARVALEDAAAHLLGRGVRRHPLEVARHHALDRPLPHAVLERRVEELTAHRTGQPRRRRRRTRRGHRRRVHPPLDELLLGPRHRRARRHHEEVGHRQLGGPRRRRQHRAQVRDQLLAHLEGGAAAQPRRRRGGMAAAAERPEDLAEVDAGGVAARDQGDVLALAEDAEEQRQVEELERPRDQRRQLVDEAAELERHHPHPVAAQAQHPHLAGHPVQHLEVLRVEAVDRPAAHRGELAAAVVQPGRGLVVAARGGGEGQRAGVLVDPHQQERRLQRRRLEAGLAQRLGHQRGGGADRRVDPAARQRQVVVGGRVVVVGHDRHLRARRQPLAEHPDAAPLADVAQDHPLDRGRVDLPLAHLLELHQAVGQHAAHRLLARAGEEELRRRVEPPGGDHRGEGVEVGPEVGGDQLHGALTASPRPTSPRRGAGGRGPARPRRRAPGA